MSRDVLDVTPLEAIRRELREYIGMNFMYDGGTMPLDNHASLAQEGIIDPTGVLELVLWIEENYGVEVAEADLVPENFDSIDALASYVARRLADE